MTSFRLSRIIAVVLLAVALLALIGCGGNKVADNFGKVKTDMSPKEVEDLLGAPKDSVEIDAGGMFKGLGGDMPKVPGMEEAAGALGKITVKYWEEGDKGYVVQFRNDKVIQFGSGTKDEMQKKMKK
jgi:hypothetical protein